MTRRDGIGGMLRGARWPVAIALLALLILTWASSAEAQGEPASISGTVNDSDGSPITQVDVDLFTESRAGYLRSSTTGVDGAFSFTDVEPGCYVVTFIAPVGFSFEDGSDYRNTDVCVADGEAVVDVDATVIDRVETATVVAEVRERFNGQLIGGVAVDLFSSDSTGRRIEYLRSGTTLPDGSGFEFVDLVPDCYVVTFIAPDGAFFNNGNSPTPWFNQLVCIRQPGVRTVLAVIDGAVTSANLRVIVTDLDSNAVEGVVVDLFGAGPDGSREDYLESSRTSSAGITMFQFAPGCYVAVVIAPLGQLFPNGTQWEELSVCLEGDQFETVIVSLA